jgi:hypothetical protein
VQLGAAIDVRAIALDDNRDLHPSDGPLSPPGFGAAPLSPSLDRSGADAGAAPPWPPFGRSGADAGAASP